MNKTVIPNYTNYLANQNKALTIISTLDNVERIKEVRPLFKDYFTHIYAHIDISNFDKLENAMLLYWGVNYSCWSDICGKQIGEIILDSIEPNNNILWNNVFFDSRNIINFNEPINNYDCIAIKLSRQTDRIRELKIIGYYFPEKNVLLGADWSHDELALQVTKLIRDELIQKLNLKPLTETKLNEPKKLIYPKIKKSEITVGCDPEFEPFDLNKRKIVAASWGDYDSEIGVDGSGEPAEFRPKASSSPKEVANKLEDLFNRFVAQQPNLRLLCSGHKFALGGHIHVGVGKYYNPEPELLQLLDDFLGLPFYECSGHARDCYLGFSLARSQPWGFEYRTPPSAIFYNKKIATVALKIAKNLVYKYLNAKGKTLEYNYPPVYEDYKKIVGLTKADYKTLKKWSYKIEELIHNKPYLVAAWGANKKFKLAKIKNNTIYNVYITQADSWVEECFNMLYSELEEAIKPLTKKHKINIKIHLFGYREDRNLASNIYISDGWGMVDYPSYNGKSGDTITFSIGLPFSVRMDLSKINYWCPDIRRGIYKVINEKLKTGFLAINEEDDINTELHEEEDEY